MGMGGGVEGRATNPCLPRILYSAKISLRYELAINTFSEKKLIEFMVSRPVLQEMLKFFSQKNITEGTLDPHNEMKSSSH